MKAFGVSLKIWRRPEMFTVFRFKRRAHMFFLALYLCKLLKMISGWLQRLFLGKVISNLLVGCLQMEHLLFWQRLEIEVLTFQVLPTGKKRRQRTKYLRQLNFEPAKKLESFSCSQLLQKCFGFSRMQLWPSLGWQYYFWLCWLLGPLAWDNFQKTSLTCF